MSRELGIYIHIPFCVSKCKYCDFLSGPSTRETRDAYVEKLLEEIDLRALAGEGRDETGELRPVVSVFLGGGTPTTLSGEQIGRIMERVRENFALNDDAEITIEANPGTLTATKLEALRKAGINRLSIGLQSTEDEQLKKLGRIHTFAQFLENFKAAREAGFENISVDLMNSLPGQSVESWEKTLRTIIDLGVEHLSAYSLIIEPETPFYEIYHEDDEAREEGKMPKLLPTEEDDRQMYHLTRTILADAGFHRYEISNYAKEGRESVHNSLYWQRKDYLGFGLGAASLLNEHRFTVTRDLQEYLQGDFARRDEQELSWEETIEETMFLGLRMMRGVNAAAFEDTFGVSLMEQYGDVIHKQIEEGLGEMTGGWYRLTEKGLDVSNYCMSEFML